MSLYTTTTSEGPSFNHRKLERRPRMGMSLTRRKLREHTYIVDFTRLKKALGHDVDLFYFYPQEINGFIISSVLSTQREHEDRAIVDRFAYNDLVDAYQDWRRKEEEASWRTGTLASYNGMSIDDYEMNQAERAAETVTDFVTRQMSVIRDAHGDYALNIEDFKWTDLGALMFKVYF